jgi:hypothetical protein
MRRVLHEGQTPRPLQEDTIRKSCPQPLHRARAKPWRGTRTRVPAQVPLHEAWEGAMVRIGFPHPGASQVSKCGWATW